MSSTYIVFAIALAAILTYITRLLPFVYFDKKEPTKTLKYIEIYMPSMIMIVLVFYALKDVDFYEYPHGVAEVFGIVVTMVVHLVFKQALLSIVTATIAYMIMVQYVI